MRKFILKTLILSLPLLILSIPTEYLLQQIPNDYTYKKNYLDEYSSKIKILIFGASHEYYGINPIYFPIYTFNACHVSQTLDFDLAILNKYRNKLDSMKVVVVSIDYSTLFSKLEYSTEAWRVKNYTLYYGIKSKSVSNYFELLNNTLDKNIYRLVNYYIKQNNDITCTELGWGTSYNSKNAKNLQETGKTAAIRHTVDYMFSKKNIKIFEENLKILNSFSEFCNQQNVKLFLITTPTYYTYRENLNAEQLKKMAETINDFINRHPNSYYFNWSEDSDFVAKDFYDADHLNEIGAEKLSKKLANDIDSFLIYSK